MENPFAQYGRYEHTDIEPVQTTTVPVENPFAQYNSEPTNQEMPEPKKTLGQKADDFYKSIAMGTTKAWNKAAGTADWMNAGLAQNIAKGIGRPDVASNIAEQDLKDQEDSTARGEWLDEQTPNKTAGFIAENVLDPVSIGTMAVGGPITGKAIGGLTKVSTKLGANLLEGLGGGALKYTKPIAKAMEPAANMGIGLGFAGNPALGLALNAPRVANMSAKLIKSVGVLGNAAASVPMGSVRNTLSKALATGLNIGGVKATLNTARDIGEARVTGTEEQPKGQIYGATLD